MGFTEARYHQLNHKTGDDILYSLKAGNHDIYIMAFYHPNQSHQHLKNSNQHLIEGLKGDFLEKNDIKDLYFAAIDGTNPTYSRLMYELEIDVNDLKVEPALFIMEHGNGFIMTGPRAINEMKMNLNELLDNRSKGY
ncbi:unnamed protein product [Moneuplotes crassus]|uniref:Uncharacterized protein n=2 Tax=Euplotes crassus TaxID=5936 RepID=A0AAD1XWG8_EUPCR|nr:unnamed protein product [Moneuplotes crassus]